MSHFRQTQHGLEPIPVEETSEYQAFKRAMARPGLVGGYLAQMVAPFITVYLPTLREGDNYPPFLQSLLSASRLASEISRHKNDWKYLGYHDRPLPVGAEALRRIQKNNQIEVNGHTEAQIPPTHHAHAFMPWPEHQGSRGKKGFVHVDREKYYDCGEHSFVGSELVPLTETLYRTEYSDSFKEKELFCFERSPIVWEIKNVEIMIIPQYSSPMMVFSFEQK